MCGSTAGKIPINSVAVSLHGARWHRLHQAEPLRTHHPRPSSCVPPRICRPKACGAWCWTCAAMAVGYLNAAVELCDEFLPDGSKIVYTEGKHPSTAGLPRRPGRGSWTTCPLAVLIDEGSASRQRDLGGRRAGQRPGIIVVGRRSFGKGLVQEHIGVCPTRARCASPPPATIPQRPSIQRPYGEGIDYNEDLEARFDPWGTADRRTASTSIPPRSTAPLLAATVYGGGGIMPDVFVPRIRPTALTYLTELFFSGALNQFASTLRTATGRNSRRSAPHRTLTRSLPGHEKMLNELEDLCR
jgi:carboxyl-terminal processing protease